MDLNLTSLTKGWIQFLKNNQVVSTQSNPKTARLNYKRQPNVTDLMKFLEVNTDFDESDIRKAIKTTMSRKGGTAPEVPALPGKSQGNVSTWHQTQTTPGQAQEPSAEPAVPLPQQEKPKKYSTDDAEDVEFREPGEKKQSPRTLGYKKPRYKYKGPGKVDRLSEDFYDRQGMEMSEDDVKNVFRILLEPKAKPTEPTQEVPGEEELKAQRQEYVRKLKELIRNSMTPAQRKALWRALNDNELSEAIINRADVNAIFKDAAYLKNKPSGLGKIFKGFRKDSVNVEDLRKAWADGLEPDGSDGYSNDTADIKRILHKFGFKDPEINKVFSKVFNSGSNDEAGDDEEANPVGSRLVQRVADMAKEKGIDKAIRSFLEQEFGEELGINKKATYEDIRNIFTDILQEERSGRVELIKQEERLRLGRTKK